MLVSFQLPTGTIRTQQIAGFFCVVMFRDIRLLTEPRVDHIFLEPALANSLDIIDRLTILAACKRRALGACSGVYMPPSLYRVGPVQCESRLTCGRQSRQASRPPRKLVAQAPALTIFRSTAGLTVLLISSPKRLLTGSSPMATEEVSKPS